MENWKNGQLIGTEPDPEPETEIHPVPPTIEEQILALQNALISQKISGGGITTITDSSDNRIKDFELFGKSEQLTTTGTQLFDWKPYLTTVGSKEQFKEKLSEGYTVLRGIAVSTNVIQYGTGNQVVMCMKVKSDTQYFFGGYKKSNIVFLNDSLDVVGNTDRATFSTTADTAYIIAYIFNYAQDSSVQPYTLSEIKEMNIIGYGSIVKPYEPYTGEKPSPSTEYPQEIKNVGKWNETTGKYEVDVRVTGKNLIGVYNIFDSKGIDASGNIIDKPNACISDLIMVQKEQYYTLSLNNIDKTTVNAYLYDSDRKYIGYHFATSSMTREFMLKDDCFIRFVFAKPKAYILSTNIQLEMKKGSSPYEPQREPQTLTITSDRPITKWDKLIEQDGQIGWLYGSKKATFENAVVKNALDANGVRQFNIAFEDIKDSYNMSVALCNMFYPATGYEIYTQSGKNDYYMALWNKHATFTSKKLDGIFQTKESFQEWIRQSGLYVWHKTDVTDFVPLPQEEQDAIHALMTYYPTTVITADGGELDPDVEVTYIADTKNYIDQKIAAINKTVVETQKALL